MNNKLIHICIFIVAFILTICLHYSYNDFLSCRIHIYVMPLLYYILCFITSCVAVIGFTNIFRQPLSIAKQICVSGVLCMGLAASMSVLAAYTSFISDEYLQYRHAVNSVKAAVILYTAVCLFSAFFGRLILKQCNPSSSQT